MLKICRQFDKSKSHRMTSSQASCLLSHPGSVPPFRLPSSINVLLRSLFRTRISLCFSLSTPYSFPLVPTLPLSSCDFYPRFLIHSSPFQLFSSQYSLDFIALPFPPRDLHSLDLLPLQSNLLSISFPLTRLHSTFLTRHALISSPFFLTCYAFIFVSSTLSPRSFKLSPLLSSSSLSVFSSVSSLSSVSMFLPSYFSITLNVLFSATGVVSNGNHIYKAWLHLFCSSFFVITPNRTCSLLHCY